MIKKIIELSKVFIKDYFQNLDIFNKNTGKINKKSVFSWLLIITIIAITFLSFKVINWLDARGMAEVFLKIYFPIMATVFMFQSILVCTNVFYFSKDLEYILPLPIKPVELLIAKFNNVISIIYCMELICLVTPLLVYGLIVAKTLIYFITIILVLIIFPIFLVTIINLIMLFVMQLSKFIKNKDIFQIIVVFVIIIIMTYTEGYLLKSIFYNNNIIEMQSTQNSEVEEAEKNLEIFNKKLDNLNNYFVTINPCISMLTNFKFTNIIWQLIKLIFICAITFFIFIILGKILYLKNLLKNIAYINKKKNNKKIIKNKYKKNTIKKSYIKNNKKSNIFYTMCFSIYIYNINFIIYIKFIFTNFYKYYARRRFNC